MSLKRLKVIDVFIIFALCFLTHFIYSWFPNTLFSIFFPVNESIWEHMKMLFSAIIIFSVVDFIPRWKPSGASSSLLGFYSYIALLSLGLLGADYWIRKKKKSAYNK